jgi:hypothetical protein
MRLIDADALNKELQKRVGSPTDEKLYEANLCIIDAPTIDAISVEWLESKRKEALHEGMRPDEVKAVEMVLWMWQKEQEART